jgi:glycogen(starch) synthase
LPNFAAGLFSSFILLALRTAPTILLASVLKPLDDTRMYGKFARTLADGLPAPGQVWVAGRQAAAPDNASSNLRFSNLLQGSRLSLQRLWAQVRYWRLLRRVQPGIVVVHAPELLPLTLLWQRKGHGRQFIYDVRENYALNIRSQGVYPAAVRGWLASGLRWVEARAANRAAAVVLAEASYAAELPFLARLPASRVLLLENKYQPQAGEVLPRATRPRPLPTEPIRLLFSGTISELNGVHEAIGLARQLRSAWPGGVRLTIIGFCQQVALLTEIQQVAATESAWLTLIGGVELVPHTAIVAYSSTWPTACRCWCRPTRCGPTWCRRIRRGWWSILGSRWPRRRRWPKGYAPQFFIRLARPPTPYCGRRKAKNYGIY